MGIEIVRLDHVQLAMPPGLEAQAEAFYAGVLGLERVPKPPPLEARGGCWFRHGDVAVHLGVEEDFRPARKAHPAFVVKDLTALQAACEEAGVEVRPNPDSEPGRGAYVDDPFGNRIELIAAD
ncbi:MAG TPA: VOC family protein [Acidimicrobiales bacterium]|nr:VOC family protein [Acidimicrobiales bacterium]